MRLGRSGETDFGVAGGRRFAGFFVVIRSILAVTTRLSRRVNGKRPICLFLCNSLVRLCVNESQLELKQRAARLIQTS